MTEAPLPIPNRPGNLAEADLTLDRLLRANIPGGWRHYLDELRGYDWRTLAPCQRRTIRSLARKYLFSDGTPRDDTAVNSSWIHLLDAILATSHTTAERHDLELMRDLLAKRPAQPIPPTWPDIIARHAWRAGLVRGQA